ncbi:cation:proton antiporter, partial [Candidatus Woesearchaeota archaeon]
MNIVLFFAIIFALTFILGKLLEKIRIPWIFAALLIGLGLAVYNPFFEITSGQTFKFMAQLGMYFLLFIIGFELDIKEIMKCRAFIFKSTIFIILAEAFIGSLFVHYILDVHWLVSILLATSFATVGEAALLPILDEFKLVKTKFGQTVLGIGVLDDVFEVLTFIFLSLILAKHFATNSINLEVNVGLTIFILITLTALMFLLIYFKKYLQHFNYKDVPSFFIVFLFFIFLFIGIGQLADVAALAAILAGVALKNIMPDKLLALADKEIRAMAYGFFAPLFFLSVGLDVNVSYLLKYPLLVLFFMILIKGTKIVASIIMGKKVFGLKKSILLGISLSVKFSTSIVIIKVLFDKGLIDGNVFSIFIG